MWQIDIARSSERQVEFQEDHRSTFPNPCRSLLSVYFLNGDLRDAVSRSLAQRSSVRSSPNLVCPILVRSNWHVPVITRP